MAPPYHANNDDAIAWVVLAPMPSAAGCRPKHTGNRQRFLLAFCLPIGYNHALIFGKENKPRAPAREIQGGGVKTSCVRRNHDKRSVNACVLRKLL